MVGQVTCGDPRRDLPQEVVHSMNELLGSVLSVSTLESYRRAWSVYEHFCADIIRHDTRTALSISDCAIFIAYLHSKNLAPATIASYLSAVCFVFKWLGLPDPSSAFVIKKLIGAASSLRSRPDIRLPITKQILSRLIAALTHICPQQYTQVMLAAMFVTAFYAFMRIGEMAPRSRSASGACLQYDDVSLTGSEVILSILRFKSSGKQGPQFIHLQSCSSPCPVQHMSSFLQQRDHQPGPLFVFPSGIPILRREFDNTLRQALQFCGLDSGRFKGHSFRIGAASAAAAAGKSDTQIRLLGRWSSDAFRKYIRIN